MIAGALILFLGVGLQAGSRNFRSKPYRFHLLFFLRPLDAKYCTKIFNG
jgi:hypothetical protein